MSTERLLAGLPRPLYPFKQGGICRLIGSGLKVWRVPCMILDAVVWFVKYRSQRIVVYGEIDCGGAWKTVSDWTINLSGTDLRPGKWRYHLLFLNGDSCAISVRAIILVVDDLNTLI